MIAVAALPPHWKKMLADLVAAGSNADASYYCGQCVNEAYLKAINVSVVDRRTFVPLPAAFSASPLFEDVQLSW